MDHSVELRINPRIDRLVCSVTGREVDSAIPARSRVLLLLTASHLVPLGQRRAPGWE